MQIWLQPGDVVRLQEGEHVVDLVNDCRARCVPLGLRTVQVTPKLGDPRTFRARASGYASIAPRVEQSFVVRRLTAAELADTLSRRKPAGPKEVIPQDEMIQERAAATRDNNNLSGPAALIPPVPPADDLWSQL